jgi:hypothetical protein
MCWISNKKPIEKLAKRNILVYKIGAVNEKKKDNFFSYFLLSVKNGLSSHFEYDKNVKAEIVELHPIKTIDSYCFYIEKGYHSYSGECHYKTGKNGEIRLCGICYYNGTTIGKFIIPKGSKYFLNENGEYVSNQIEFVDSFKTPLNSNGKIKEIFKNIKNNEDTIY